MASTSIVMETQFAERFRDIAASESNAALRALREDAFAAFSLVGFPTVKNEDWKYTSVAAAVRPDWNVTTHPSEALTTGDVELLREFSFRRNGFAGLNVAFGEFRVVRIPKETSVSEPIEMRFVAANNSAIFPHTLVVAEDGAKATIVETFYSRETSLTNSAIQIVVGDNANITHYRVQRDGREAFNFGTSEVSLGRGSRYDSTNINLGGAVSRHDIDLKFTDEGGEAFVDGLYMLNGSQHHDTHSIIDHTVPNCISHQTYKGVLNDNSRGVFNGKVFVRENAHGTDANQSNKNLLLSDTARVDTKPQLEIFNDDVKCSHGATVGQLEEDELFYLLTRGLPMTLAKNLLTYGFAEEVINKIGIESIKSELDAAVLNRLKAEIQI
jgi:Fe-S cluster assembly protein SufD